ncbi:hypothetical protein LTR50_007478 [Elasticomyces elasticus]|nr:hypothetical protein LTR50_007478 [Elasticomyces elasticus]
MTSRKEPDEHRVVSPPPSTTDNHIASTLQLTPLPCDNTRTARQSFSAANDASHSRSPGLSTIAGRETLSRPNKLIERDTTLPARPASHLSRASSETRPLASPESYFGLPVTRERARSPKRPPASRCSKGIGTSHGPPPTLQTRALLSPELVDSSSYGLDSGPVQYLQGGLSDGWGEIAGRVSNTEAQRAEMSDTRSYGEPAHEQERAGEQDSGMGQSEGTHGPEAEDLFLHLARDDSEDAPGQRPHSRNGSKRTRAVGISKRQSLPATSTTHVSTEPRPSSSGRSFAVPSIETHRADEDQQRLHPPRFSRLTSPSASSFRSQTDAMSVVSSASRADRSNRYAGLNDRPMSSARDVRNRITSPEGPTYARRRPSFTSTVGIAPPRNAGPASRNVSVVRHPQNGTPTEPPVSKQSLQDSDSADSVTAPSTVWDELDDLKSRIKKLELTGKLPATSGAAVSNDTAERPRTATTAPTTVSLSPQHMRKSSGAAPEATVEANAANQLYPLLHAALARARTYLNPALYRTLETTAGDALALAAMTGGAGPQGTAFTAASIVNGAAVSDRHIRRKADNMCRNLTDLCIALCDGKDDPTARPVRSRDSYESPATHSRQLDETVNGHFSRQSSLEPAEPYARNTPSRALGRVEARRSSLMTLNHSANNSPRAVSNGLGGPDADPRNQQQPDRQSRAGTSFLRTRYSRFGQETEDDPTIRAPSRAMTDAGSAKQAHHFRRDYSGNDASPAQQRSPSLRETLAARRGNLGAHEANGEVRSPTASVHDGARRFLERFATQGEEDEQQQQLLLRSAAKQRRFASLGQYDSGLRTASSLGRSGSVQASRDVVVE